MIKKLLKKESSSSKDKILDKELKVAEKVVEGNKKRKFSYLVTIFLMKVFLIVFLIYGLYEYETDFSNEIALLAVSENEEGEIVAGSVIDLALTIKPGNGNIFVGLNTIEELDTQISIINSNKIACNLFELDCNNYDFFYEFDSNSLVLKGPSASSAIAILTAKTVFREKIDTDYASITGSLNSGGLIGVVGGVDKKIEVAKRNGFKKVLVPAFADMNTSINHSGIEVVKVLDVIDAYNNFKGTKYRLNSQRFENEGYESLMKKLAEDLCVRSGGLKLEIDESLIENETTNFNYLNGGNDGLNSSKSAIENENFYSAGSYCYSANLNFRNILENQKNISIKVRDEKIESLEAKIDDKIEEFTSLEFKENIKTINDFYVYLVLIDRIFESKELAEKARELEVDFSSFENPLNLSVNDSDYLSKTIELNETLRGSISNGIKLQKETLYSYSLERFYTVSLWENFIDHSGGNIVFSDSQIDEVCSKINREISIKDELLQNYNLDIFNDLINTQFDLNKYGKNKYLCVYKGLELDGRINTVLNSLGLQSKDSEEFLAELVDLTQSRIHLNSNGEFPFIPTIYAEYSKDLINSGDFATGMLYSNYALSYANLNIYLEKEEPKQTVVDATMDRLFENILFVITIMIIIAFLN